jgi:hypothetical protein
MGGQAQVLEIVFALRTPRCFPCLLNGREKEGDQNGDDCDHDQQLDQRESAAILIVNSDGGSR